MLGALLSCSNDDQINFHVYTVNSIAQRARARGSIRGTVGRLARSGCFVFHGVPGNTSELQNGQISSCPEVGPRPLGRSNHEHGSLMSLARLNPFSMADMLISFGIYCLWPGYGVTPSGISSCSPGCGSDSLLSKDFCQRVLRHRQAFPNRRILNALLQLRLVLRYRIASVLRTSPK